MDSRRYTRKVIAAAAAGFAALMIAAAPASGALLAPSAPVDETLSAVAGATDVASSVVAPIQSPAPPLDAEPVDAIVQAVPAQAVITEAISSVPRVVTVERPATALEGDALARTADDGGAPAPAPSAAAESTSQKRVPELSPQDPGDANMSGVANAGAARSWAGLWMFPKQKGLAAADPRRAGVPVAPSATPITPDLPGGSSAPTHDVTAPVLIESAMSGPERGTSQEDAPAQGGMSVTEFSAASGLGDPAAVGALLLGVTGLFLLVRVQSRHAAISWGLDRFAVRPG